MTTVDTSARRRPPASGTRPNPIPGEVRGTTSGALPDARPPGDLAEVFGAAIDDTTAVTSQLADLLEHLTADRRLIGPRLANAWHLHHDPNAPAGIVAIAEPITAGVTLRTVETAGDDLAGLIDAFRACLHAQVETGHQLAGQAHHTSADTGLDTCPACPPAIGALGASNGEGPR